MSGSEKAEAAAVEAAVAMGKAPAVTMEKAAAELFGLSCSAQDAGSQERGEPLPAPMSASEKAAAEAAAAEAAAAEAVEAKERRRLRELYHSRVPSEERGQLKEGAELLLDRTVPSPYDEHGDEDA